MYRRIPIQKYTFLVIKYKLFNFFVPDSKDAVYSRSVSHTQAFMFLLLQLPRLCVIMAALKCARSHDKDTHMNSCRAASVVTLPVLAVTSTLLVIFCQLTKSFLKAIVTSSYATPLFTEVGLSSLH